MKSLLFGFCLIALLSLSSAQRNTNRNAATAAAATAAATTNAAAQAPPQGNQDPATVAAEGIIARTPSVGPKYPYATKPDVFDLCFAGREQSPIDIQTNAVVQNNNVKLQWFLSTTAIPQLKLLDDPNEIKVIANFSAIRATGLDGQTNDFIDQNFHFHFGEHALNGRIYDFEAHVIHFITAKSLARTNVRKTTAIIAIPYQVDYSANAKQSALVNAFALNNPGQTLTINFQQILNADGLQAETGFYAYAGAVTVPNCDETVTWYILQKPLSISAAQKQMVLTRAAASPELNLGFGNSKSLVDLNGRTVTASNSLTISTLAQFTPN